MLTFLSIVTAMVMFRSDSVTMAVEVYKGMLGINGIYTNAEYAPPSFLTHLINGALEAHNEDIRILILLLFIGLALSLCFPNTSKILATKRSIITKILVEKKVGAIFIAALFAICILQMNYVSPFLYFQF